MKNVWNVALIAVLQMLFITTTQAQADWCATHTLVEQEIAGHPEKAAFYEKLWSVESATNGSARGTENDPFIIPVVFHVIHDNGIGNIPYEQIVSAVEVLNEDFRRMNSDTGNTRDVFKPFAVDSEVEFRLAKIDPDGNCTNGVVRVNSPNFTYNVRNQVKTQSYWPSHRYLNVWVVNSIENFSGGGGIVLGYAQFPGGNWNTYGIVNRHDRLGKLGVGTSVSDGRTLTHEVGHCLNLLHTFQSGCGSNCSSSGDRVCDTPPSDFATYGCSQGQNTCSNDDSGSGSPFSTDVVDQIENYMSYDDCQNMFSAGQRDRMHAVLTGISQLVNLVSESNLQATGVLDTTERICKADFEISSQLVCMGQPVQFTDRSYFNPQGHSWNFPGGYPEVSSDTNPVVVYTVPGTYPVSLEVTDGTDTVSTTRTNYITVLPYASIDAPVVEGFEFTSGGLEQNDWYADNAGGSYGWELSGSESYSGTASLMMRQFGANDGRASIAGPKYSMSGYTSATISFKVAYAQRASDNNDILRVYVSNDCGENWVLRFVRGGSSMASLPITGAPISGLSQSDWNEFSFNVEENYLTENFRLRFDVLTDGGNDIFIDDINIVGSKGAVPALVYPVSGFAQASPDEVLDWKSSSPADNYEVLLDTTPDFNSPVLRIHSQPYVNAGSNGTDTEWRPSGLVVGNTYYWKVRSVNAGVPSDWSDTWFFTVGNQGPPLSTASLRSNNQVALYPNPARESVRITTTEAVKEVTVISGTGRLVMQVSNTDVVDVSQLPVGMYIVSVTTETTSTQHKLIIER